MSSDPGLENQLSAMSLQGSDMQLSSENSCQDASGEASSVDGGSSCSALADPALNDSASTQHLPTTSGAQHCLMDLPGTWLKLLAAHAPAAILSLFMTCRPMRDWVMSQCNTSLQFTLPLTAPQTASAQHSLLLACQHSASIKVVLVGSFRLPTEAHTSACDLMSGAMTAVGQGLAPVTSVVLQGLVLDALVPSWLTTTCPNMTTLTLQSCQFLGLPAPTTAIPTCGQLKNLQVVATPELPSVLSPGGDWPGLKHQMQALSGLQSLGVSCQHMNWLDCFSVLGPQLTQLSLSSNDPGSVSVPAQFGTWFTSVRELSLTGVQCDDGMEVLLGMPGLRFLRCKGFDLQQSYTHYPCVWNRVRFQELHVASFARLPMESVQCFQVAAQVCILRPSPDIQATRRVVAAVGRCGGLQWGDEIDSVTVHNPGLAGDACFVTMLPLLSGCSARTIAFTTGTQEDLWMVTPELIASIGHSLSITKLSYATIRFEAGCVFANDVWPFFLPLLPPSVRRVYLRVGNMSEVVVAEMCARACRPVTVEISSISAFWWESSWAERVRAVMVVAGHQLVRLAERT